MEEVRETPAAQGQLSGEIGKPPYGFAGGAGDVPNVITNGPALLLTNVVASPSMLDAGKNIPR